MKHPTDVEELLVFKDLRVLRCGHTVKLSSFFFDNGLLAIISKERFLKRKVFIGERGGTSSYIPFT